MGNQNGRSRDQIPKWAAHRFLFPRHSHGGTLTHKSPTPAGVRLCGDVNWNAEPASDQFTGNETMTPPMTSLSL